MEHFEGETLERRLARGSLSLEQVLRYAIEIANALDHAALLASSSAAWLRQHVESHLTKVIIGRDGVGQSQFLHGNEARTVSEGEALVSIAEEHLSRSLETVTVNAFPSQTWTSVDLMPPFLGGIETESDSDERKRLIGDQVSRDQRPARFERGIP
jgi:hypothetical protein